MILDTSASPRPDPLDFVVTNGSNRCGNRSSGTPGPLSLTQNSSGSDTRVLLPGSDRRTPGRNAVERRAYRCRDRKSTRLNSSHVRISYAVFCLKKKKRKYTQDTTHTTLS